MVVDAKDAEIVQKQTKEVSMGEDPTRHEVPIHIWCRQIPVTLQPVTGEHGIVKGILPGLPNAARDVLREISLWQIEVWFEGNREIYSRAIISVGSRCEGAAAVLKKHFQDEAEGKSRSLLRGIGRSTPVSEQELGSNSVQVLRSRRAASRGSHYHLGRQDAGRAGQRALISGSDAFY